ncbi:MAG: T9SS type A sorting domain-containing protein [Limnohabitans sp.]|nr:T9SS type A sorting domain-containing protein [Limnohabitans sp.]
MKKNLLIFNVCFLFLSAAGFAQAEKGVDKKDKKQIVKEAKALRKKHSKFLAHSPFKKTMEMGNDQRKAAGLPPNKYFEQEWELTMNPELGRPTGENLEAIRKQLDDERRLALLTGRTPGDASDNAWVERGPNNVGGRTRAIMFDPNDATKNTVFAGGVSGGLWKNTNISSAASTWTRINTFPENLNISKIIADPNNNQIFYIGTGESYVFGDVTGNGVWKSIDAGATWTKILGGVTGSSTQQYAQNLTVNSPAGVAGNYNSIMTTAFGPAITANITADIILVNDGSAPNTDACANATTGATFTAGSMTGKIALIRRGTCSFNLKVKAVQDAGAIAAIVMNNVAGAGPIAMGGTNAAVTIPSISISKEDGDLLEAAITGGSTINATLKPTPVGQFTALLVPGLQFVNDMAIKNNAGVSELYVAGGDGYYSSASVLTLQGSRSYGLFKTTNGGTSWTELTLPVAPSGNKTCPNNVEIATNGNIWVSSTDSWTYGDGGGKVFLSTDGGSTFQLKHTVTGNGGGKRVEIEASSTNANTLYVLSELEQADPNVPTIEVSLLRTTDAFATAPTVLTLPTGNETRETTYGFTGAQAFYDLMIEADPTNDQILYVGGIDLYRSTNGGTSWTTISDWTINVHSDHHAMVFKPGDSNMAIFGNDGGVYYCGSLSAATETSTTAITARNNGYNVTQFYSVGVAPTNAVSGLGTGDYFAAGAQDNGTQYFGAAAAGINASVRSQGGDGAYTLFDQGADKYYISNYVYNGNINYRPIPSGTVRNINSESTSNGAFIAVMALDSSLDMLYTDYTASGGTATIRRYTNLKSGLVGRTALTNALLANRPSALTVSKYTTATTTLFVGTIAGKVLKVTSANGTPVWADLTATASPIVGSVSDIELGASEDQIFVTVHNYGVTSIWYTSNGTAANPTWSSLEGNLPDIPVKCILQNPLNTAELIVGTELGVWFTNGFNPAGTSAQALTWNQSYNGMSNVKVVDMDIQADSGTPTAYNVYAATYGRGVFSGQFKAPTLSVNNNVVSNSFKVYPTVTRGNVTILSDKNYGETKVLLFDLAGKKVYDNTININADSNEINFGKLSAGEYILKLSGQGFDVSKKLIFQ